MEDIRSLLMHQETLDVVLEKIGLTKDQNLIPWIDGFALTDNTGNITNYLNIDTNGKLLVQDKSFETNGHVESVVDGQYQIYENHNLIGTLFTSLDDRHDIVEFLNFDFGKGFKAIDELVDIGSESLDPLALVIEKLNLL